LFIHGAARDLVINSNKVSELLNFISIMEFFKDRLDFLETVRVKVVSLSCGLADNSAGANGNQLFSQRSNLFELGSLFS